MDYAETLNLPKTDFPMRGNLPQSEPKMQQWWDEINIYQQIQHQSNGKPKFILHDGPPFANGDIHIGHALNHILKDMIVRFKSMQGYDAPYVPGWDTHGLPIEQAIANNGKADRKKMSVAEFREYCKTYALGWIAKQKVQLQRLAIRGDWENPYITLQPEYEAQQIRVFGEMMRKGYIYKGLKPVHWSPSSESALAEAEIDYKEKTSPSIYVAFQVQDGKGKLPQDASIIIWTTTPWTLPANLGISLHPKFAYVLISVDGRKFVVAEGLLDDVAKQLAWGEVTVLTRFVGAELEYITCHHPFYDRESLVMVGEHVTLDAGTGCVHTAPGHGEDDFIIGQKYKIGVLCPIDGQGKFTVEVPELAGIFYEKANSLIIDRLQENGHLLKLSSIVHQYAHDWRTKKPVIYRATEQWFVSVEQFRLEMLQQIKQIKWTPYWGEFRLHNMIADRGDWCISRQRAWGVPIPVFYCGHCNHPFVNEQSIDKIAAIFAAEGSNAWFIKTEHELMPENPVCPKCGHNQFHKENDIMDVWFDSGSSHIAVLETRAELQWPADLYLEGSDQYRGWFNSSLITGTATRGKAPYKAVLSHGFVLDGEGRKMSKSEGNTVDPNKVCNSLGADILRLWVSSADYQSDVRISDHILTQITEVYRKIRNTLRFLLSNLTGFDPVVDRVKQENLNELDRFALAQLGRMTQHVLDGYESFEFHLVYQSIHHFCAVELSAFYLDIVKDRLYASASQSMERKAAQTVLYEALIAITQLIAPILPHTADEVWKFIPGVEQASVQLSRMPSGSLYDYDKELEMKWLAIIDIRDEVLKALEDARSRKMIGNALGASVALYADAKTVQLLGKFSDLAQLFIVSEVVVHCAETPVPSDALKVKNLAIKVSVAKGAKCERCWNVTPEVGIHLSHPTLCTRCNTVVMGHEYG